MGLPPERLLQSIAVYWFMQLAVLHLSAYGRRLTRADVSFSIPQLMIKSGNVAERPTAKPSIRR